MELEEMKALWQEMSADIENQKKLTSTIIIKMTQANYRNKINNILLPEAAGAGVCIAMALLILVNLQKFSTWYLLGCAVTSAIILCMMPWLSVSAIRRLRRVNIAGNNYRESLTQYSKARLQFVFAQKVNFLLGAILLVTVFPVMVALMDGKDLFKQNWLWLRYAVAFPFYYGFAKWVFKKYVKMAAAAGDILKEVAEG